MNILEIIWIVSTLIILFYTIRYYLTYKEMPIFGFYFSFMSILVMIFHYVRKYKDFLTTPLW